MLPRSSRGRGWTSLWTIPRHDVRCRLPPAGDMIARGVNTTVSL